MFSGRNILISGGTFNQGVARTQASISFDKLAGKASPRAFHLADSDPSHAACFNNTRTKILERLKGWATRTTDKEKFVMWLHGAAGGGKTAIARTIAKWCELDEGILLAEFFFSRGNGTGDQLFSLAPTLAYKMAVHTLKDAKYEISNAISHDPHIFLAPLQNQLTKLVLEPFDAVAPCGIMPYVIILDGLDETLTPDEQQLVLDAIMGTLYKHNPTLRILVCSRPEPVIVTMFHDPDSVLSSISLSLSLNDDMDSDSDIRTFLVEKFNKIRKQLPYPPTGEWPTSDNIEYLVAKSSSQFIFAATVEKYVGSPNHRHNAVSRLKHVLDLGLLPHLEDKNKHPFADLDALYSLILKTRNEVGVSVKAMAVCLQYPKYFDTVSPSDLSNVLGIEMSETWAILYELASLLDVSEHNIRPFHASFSDFLYDETRSLDLYCSTANISTDIACAMLRRGRDSDAILSYQVMSSLLGDARPREDLGDILTQMAPASFFGRSQGKRPKGGYYLVPLLRQIKNHISYAAYQLLATYFDENMTLLLPYGRWKKAIFQKDDNIKKKQETTRKVLKSNDESDSSDSMIPLMSVSSSSEDYDSSDEDSDTNEQSRRAQTKTSLELKPVNHYVPDLVPFIAFTEWDEVRNRLNISLKGPDVLVGLCEEAEFSRTHLPGTLSAILAGPVQLKASLFCLNEIKSTSIQDDARIAFAKLLSKSLQHSEQSSNLTTSIEDLLTQHPNICRKLPSMTMQAISKYLDSIPSHGSNKPTTSGTERRAVTKSSQTAYAQATSNIPASRKTASAPPMPDTSDRTGPKPASGASSQINTVNIKTQSPMQPQTIRRPFLVPSSRSTLSASPGSSRKESTPPQTVPTTGVRSGINVHPPSSSRSSGSGKKSFPKAQPLQTPSRKPSITPLEAKSDVPPLVLNTEPVESGSVPHAQSQSGTSQKSNKARKKKSKSQRK